MKRTIILLSAIFCLVYAMAFAASIDEKKQGLKIFISADIEGVAGVVTYLQSSSQGSEYEKAREWMTNEVLAAIEGARAVGATEFLVADSHGSMQNLLPDKFGTDTRLVRGWCRPYAMMQGLDESFDAVIFIGYHAQAGSKDAVLDHTMTGNIYNLRVNGITIPEAGFNAIIAGYYDVPVVMISGDKAVINQSLNLFGDIETAMVMEGIAEATNTLSPQASCELIKKKAEIALKRLKDFKPYKLEAPYKMEIDFRSEYLAEVASWIPGVKREANRTISYTTDDVLEMARLLRVIVRFIHI
jgi:D-amino peptidase